MILSESFPMQIMTAMMTTVCDIAKREEQFEAHHRIAHAPLYHYIYIIRGNRSDRWSRLTIRLRRRIILNDRD